MLVVCYLSFSVDCSTREILLVKTNSFVVNGYSEFWVRDRSLCLLLSSLGTHCLTCAGRVNAATVSMNSCALVLLCLHASFSWCPSPPTDLTLFPLSLLQSSLNLEGRDLEPSHLGMNIPKSLCTLLSCGSLPLLPSATGRSFCECG